MTKTLTYQIRVMTRQEVDLAAEWAAQEGWNPGIHDADCFYYTDPDGFFIGELDGEPIACISAITYRDNFGFIGFYIVKPQYRGKGYGIQIWNRAMEYLKGRNIGLDGVVAQQENYKKSGFKLAYRNVRYEGIAVPSESNGTMNLSNIPFRELLEYDRQMFSLYRPEFLKLWIMQPEGAALGIRKDGNLAGYGVIRACRKGFKIGPLFADNEDIAERIFNGLNSRVPEGEPIFLDTPEPNEAAIALAERHGMKRVFETARMYTGDTDILPVEKIFGVTSFELG